MSNILKGLNEQTAFEGTFILTETRTYKLWESAGQKLMEAQLTADQINQIFQWVEQDVTAGGNNRTMLGKGKDAAGTAITKGKDAAVAVNKAWEELKSKVQNSGPIQNLDAQYDKAAEKLKQATGGDQGVMQYVQKYRDFAKKHPVAQSLIYSALIAAAGISGAGLGGAAALGLFKMVDKLLQGEKFSSAAYSGAKTGAMAYAAGQVGQALKGGEIPSGPGMDAKFADVSGTMPDGTVLPTDSVASSIQSQMDILKDLGLSKDASYGQVVKAMKDQGWPSDWVSGTIQDAGRRAAASTASDVASSAVSQGLGAGTNAFKDPAVMNSLTKAASTGGREAVLAQINQVAPAMSQNAKQMMIDVAMKKAGLKESVNLSEAQVFFVFGSIVQRQQLQEGVMDTIKGGLNKAGAAVKGAVSKAANYAATKGKNLTNKVTADKLLQAWKKAGSPTDSLDVASIIQRAGVSPEIIKQVYADMQIPAPGQPGGGASGSRKIDVDPSSAPSAMPSKTGGVQTPQPSATSQPVSTPQPSATPQAGAAPQPTSTAQPNATTQPGGTTQPASGATAQPTGNLKQVYAQARSLLDQLDDKSQERVVNALKSDLEMAVAEEQLDENLRQWFKEKWVRFGPDGKIRGSCARGDDSEGKPKCLPQAKAHALGKKGRKYAASKKRREDPNPERRGPAKNVATKKKSNEGINEGLDYNKRQQLIKFLAKKMNWEVSYLELASDANLISWYKKVQAGKDPMKGVAEGSEAQDNLVSILNSFDYYSDNGKVYVNDAGDKIARQGPNWKHQSGKVGHGSEELGNFLSSKKDVAGGLNEFAPPGSNDGGDDGFSEETLKRLAAQWYNGDEDPRVERTLMAAGWEIGQDEGYDDEPGVFVVQSGDVNGSSYISWPADELRQGVAEGLNDTIYPNATVIKSRNGKPVGEIYQDGNEWGCFHYRADRGYDMIDSREDAIQALKDLHGETTRHRPDYTIKGVAEGLNEFAPAGGGGNIPRGPKTPKRDPWGDNGEDPYQLRRYNRSIDFFDQFDSDGVDKQKFDKDTGEYEGYYFDRDAASGITQIAYFKFDDPTKIGDNDPGIGWYYEPVDESLSEDQLDELKCWPGHHRVKGTKAGAPGSCAKNKTNEEQLEEKWSQKYKDSINCSNPKGFSQKAHCAGKKKNEDIQEEKCPECGGPMFSEMIMNEKKDACYYKVKSRYKVWPSAYASGALVKCRKKGAANWGTGGKKNESIEENEADYGPEYQDMVSRVGQKAKAQDAKKSPEQRKADLERLAKRLNQPEKKSNILRGIEENLGTPYPSTYEEENKPFMKKGSYRITAMTSENKK